MSYLKRRCTPLVCEELRDPAKAVIERLEERVQFAASIVADLGPTLASNPTGFFEVDGINYFSATDGVRGNELWATDGTTAGTYLVADITPGTSSSNPRPIANLNGVLIFAANVPGLGEELWRTDGTPEGTTLVADIRTGSLSSSPAPVRATPTSVVVGETLYFQANNGTVGIELWKTDGTAAGTQLVHDINPALASSSPEAFDIWGDKVAFIATADGGRTVWTSDGTAAGTMSTGFAPLSAIDGVNVEGGALYFTTRSTSTQPARVYRTDGTATGTQEVANVPGAGGLQNLTLFDGHLFFTTSQSTSSLYMVDASSVTPTVISGASRVSSLILLGDKLLMSASPAGTTSLLLCKVDEAGSAITPVVDALPASQPHSPRLFTVSGGIAYYVATSDNIAQYFRTDGTAAGTVRVSSFATNASLSALSFADGRPLYAYTVPNYGRELYTLDAVTGEPALLKDLNLTSNSSNPGVGAALADGRYVFPTADGKLWITDGTADGTLNLGTFVGFNFLPQKFMHGPDGRLYFIARSLDNNNTDALWTTDGTPAGTVPVGVTQNLLISTTPVVLGGEAFFQGAVAAVADLLYKFDLATGQLTPLTGTSQGGQAGGAASLTVSGGYVYFSAISGGRGRELWRTDGTIEGTVLVADLPPLYGSNPSELVDIDGTLYFRAGTSDGGQAIYRTDGTAAGTVMVKRFAAYQAADPQSLADGVGVANLTRVGRQLAFTVALHASGRELWFSDGTEAGTRLARDIVPGSGGASPANLLAVGGTLYFTANDGVAGAELWRSDGTTAGTYLLADVMPGAEGSGAAPALNANGLLLFSANDGVHGSEPWSTDGTAVGTILVEDVNPGAASSMLGMFGAAGGNAYFRATSPGTGAELWRTTDRVPPLQAEAGGPYITLEASPVTLSAVRSTGTIVSYEWDLDYDGTTFTSDASGVTTILPGLDGPLLRRVALRVTDDQGHVSLDESVVRIDNVKPVVTIAGPETVHAGATYRLDLSAANDPGADVVSHWTINWGDGTTEVVQGSPAVVSHRYMVAGAVAGIFASATDEDGTYHATGPVERGSLDPEYAPNGVVELPSGSPTAESVKLADGSIILLTQHGLRKLRSDGTPDNAFGQDGLATVPYIPLSAAASSNGQFVVLGAQYSSSGYRTDQMTRFNPDGSIDTTFGSSGTVSVVHPYNQVFTAGAFVEADGTILVTGSVRWGVFQNGVRTEVAVMRFSPTGEMDTSFGSNGFARVATSPVYGDMARAVHVLPDGRVLTGLVIRDGNDPQVYVARLTTEGELDTSYGNGGLASLQTIGPVESTEFFFRPDGSVLVAGYTKVFSQGGSNSSAVLMKFAADGTPDPEFGVDGSVVHTFGGYSGNLPSVVASAALHEETGRVVFGGRAAATPVLVAFEVDGQIDRTWGNYGVWSLPHADGMTVGQTVMLGTGQVLAVAQKSNVDPELLTRHTFATVAVRVLPAPARSVRAAADAYVSAGSEARTNFGQAQELRVARTATGGEAGQTFLRFDLTDVWSADDIESAEIRLFGGMANEGESLDVGLFGIRGGWTEDGVNWSNRPIATTAPVAVATVTGTDGAWYEFDIAEYLKDFKEAGATEVNLALRGLTHAQLGASFASDESVSNKPELRVTLRMT